MVFKMDKYLWSRQWSRRTCSGSRRPPRRTRPSCLPARARRVGSTPRQREGFEIASEHVKAFKDGNAIFNAWPYFREYLRNNLQRMGMPPLTAPFLRLQPKPKSRKREKPEREN